MSGFDCQFISQPPEFFQCYCPICLLILREPHEATCCGKTFCKECIKKIQAKNSKPCPTCKEENFNCFHSKRVQQSLYGFRVFCSNKEGGCGWQGELGQLDQHLNVDPDKDKQFVGCDFANVRCLFCKELHLRHELEDHHNEKCAKRPYTCSMCDDYKSTYEDVMTNHAPECKCRPVECPNSCGASNLQHQHLEHHMSNQCPLTLVKCEFSDAGCDAKVYRRDLPSHLSTNMVTHMSLLARENRKLKAKIKTQNEMHQLELLELKKTLADEIKITQSLRNSPPITFKCAASFLHINKGMPFYSHAEGYKLQLQLQAKISMERLKLQINIRYHILESEFPVIFPCTLKITTKVLDLKEDKDHILFKHTVISEKPEEWVAAHCQSKHHIDYIFTFCVTNVIVV